MSVKLDEIPVGAFIGGGLAIVGIGIAIFGMASCEARSAEARVKGTLEAAPYNMQIHKDQVAELKWQLETGKITSEEYVSLMNDSPLKRLFKSPTTQEK